MNTTQTLRTLARQGADALRLRPLWINALLVFCIYMSLVYVPWDLFLKPVASDEEVWFGYVFKGWAAKATEPLHWLVYAAGAWGFWKMRPWVWRWGALYTLQVGFSMCVWQATDSRGGGLMVGLVVALPFLLLAIALLRAHGRFAVPTGSAAPQTGTGPGS